MSGAIGTLQGFAQIAEMGRAIPWLAEMSAILQDAFAGDNCTERWTGVEHFLSESWSYQHYYSKQIAGLLVDMHQSGDAVTRAKEVFVQCVNANMLLEQLFTGCYRQHDGEPVEFITQAETLLPLRFTQFTNDELTMPVILRHMNNQYQINAIYTRVCQEVLQVFGYSPLLCEDVSAGAAGYAETVMCCDLGLASSQQVREMLSRYRHAQQALFCHRALIDVDTDTVFAQSG